MQTTANKQGIQMSFQFGDEWVGTGSVWRGENVYRAPRIPSVEWLSDCEKERNLTLGLMDQIADVSNLARACGHVLKNKGRGGVDGMELDEFKSWFLSNWRELQSQLLSGNYLPSAVLGVEIPKSNGGVRQLGIPTLRDRLVQQAIHQVLSPRYEQVFSAQSYGFRPKRSAHDALHKAGEYVASGRSWVVDLDLRKFFDEVNHNRLLWMLGQRVGDKRLLKLIASFLKAGMMRGGILSQRVKGTPQGGPLSPLLANIVLDELDKELERRGHKFVRYADDLIIHLSSEEAALRVLRSVSSYVSKYLHLRVNEEKSRICRPWELNFLGHKIFTDGSLGLSKESESRLKATIRQLTKRNRGQSLSQVIAELNSKLRGWLYYFRYARMKGKMQTLMSWLRRKLRCYRLKQGKRAIGVMRLLRRYGIPQKRAWTTAASSKGWWRKSLTPAANEAMNIQWFEDQGLLDIYQLYCRLQT